MTELEGQFVFSDAEVVREVVKVSLWRDDFESGIERAISGIIRMKENDQDFGALADEYVGTLIDMQKIVLVEFAGREILSLGEVFKSLKKIDRQLNKKLTVILMVAALILRASSEVKNNEKGAMILGSLANSCSFEPDCKTTELPYCNVTYTHGPRGNYGTCEAVKKIPPVQVLFGEECPQGTVKQLVFANEGDESVCLNPAEVINGK